MKSGLVIFASVFAVGVASAQMASGPSSTPPTARAAASVAQFKDASEGRRIEEHIKQLRTELQITDAEESQWENVAKTMRENAEDIDRAIDKRETVVRNATAVDNLNSYADVVQAHAAAVKRLAETFAPLYAEMSDSQKKKADQIFAHRQHTRTVAKS